VTLRPDREDLSVQVDREWATRLDVRDTLTVLAAAAKTALSRTGTTARPRRIPDLGHIYGAVDALRRAEQAHDLAALDLRTAAGEDA
jgi:hypothetical protein